MDFTERLRNVAILGAAGKMGRGITLLVVLEMARLKLLPENHGKTFVLNAIDVSPGDLQGLMLYLRGQVLRQGERQIVALRKSYTHRLDLIENHDIIQQYLWDVMSIVNPGTGIQINVDGGVVFEAVSENPHLKTSLMKTISKNNNNTPWFFTNTSSIPIIDLDRDAGLKGRIAGLHFYNPPAVQKLVEIAYAYTTLDEVKEMALHLARVIGKKVAISADVPGFIGNGHFMREIMFAIEKVENLSQERPMSHAITMMNMVTQDYLLRPMGIFQLIDYVGIDVCRHILQVMDPHFPDEQMHSSMLDMFYEKDIRGGQNPDGSQKQGFFRYKKGKPCEVFDLNKGDYIPLENVEVYCKKQLGHMPNSFMPWKTLITHPGKKALLESYFEELHEIREPGAMLALEYLQHSRQIALQLVDNQIAESSDVVNLVLETGFFHAYGPVNDYLKMIPS